MARREILDRIQEYVDPFRITKGKGFRLKDFDPAHTCGLQLDKGETAELLTRGTEWLAEEQDMLYAHGATTAIHPTFQIFLGGSPDGSVSALARLLPRTSGRSS